MTIVTYTRMKRVYSLNHHVPLECGFCVNGMKCGVKGTNNNYVFDWPCVPTTWLVNIVTP